MTGDLGRVVIMAKDATAATNRWANAAQNARQAYVDGVNGVTTAPGAAASRQRNAYLQGVQNNVDYWAKRVQVPLSDWQSATAGKGADRYTTGVQSAVPKMQAFMQNFLPKVQAIAASLPPRGTDAQNEARMLQQVRETRKLRGTL